MYKVFLVDDEELVIDSLKGSINWEDYGFEVVGFALSGGEAYERIKDIKPDIVFSDIRMPGISGLELIKKIKKTMVNTICIVISGYAEFAYAQKAINYGAFGYCLKPFDEEEIGNYLDKARVMLDSIKIANDSDFMDLIATDNEETKQSIEKILEKHGVKINLSKKITILVSIGRNMLEFDGVDVNLTFKIGYDKYAYFIQGDKKAFYEKYKEAITEEGIKSIGFSSEIDSAAIIKKAIFEAEIRAYNYFISNNKNNVFCEISFFQDRNNSIIKFEGAIGRNDIHTVVEVMDDIYILFEKGQLNIKHAMLIYNQVMSFSYRLDNEQYEDYINSFGKLTGLFSDVYEMLNYLKKLLSEKLNGGTGHTASKYINHTFKTILKYVNDNFCSDISTQSISKDLNVNASYISQLFKKEVGITFTEYLSKLRIDFACNLLRTTDLPISEIAEKIGFNDFFYFSRIFKKIKGMPPSAYRNFQT